MELEFDDLPEFFIVYITSHSSNQMTFPREFVNYMEESKAGLAELVASLSGKVWRTEVVYDGKDLYFTEGWQGFVKDNFIRDGDFMFFKFHGNLKFSVKIYDQSMCEKGIDGILEAEEKSNEVITVKRKRGRRPPPQADTLLPSKGKNAGRKATLVKPFFEKKATYPNFPLPAHFVRDNSLKYESNEKMVLRTSRNSTWQVKILKHQGGFILCAGWRAFIRESGIKLGDICRFELLDRLEMMVHMPCIRKKGSNKRRKV